MSEYFIAPSAGAPNPRTIIVPPMLSSVQCALLMLMRMSHSTVPRRDQPGADWARMSRIFKTSTKDPGKYGVNKADAYAEVYNVGRLQFDMRLSDTRKHTDLLANQLS